MLVLFIGTRCGLRLQAEQIGFDVQKIADESVASRRAKALHVLPTQAVRDSRQTLDDGTGLAGHIKMVGPRVFRMVAALDPPRPL